MKHLNYYSLLITAAFMICGTGVFAQKDTIEFESGKKKIIIVEKDKKEMNQEMMEKNKEMFEEQIEMAEEMIRKHEEMLRNLEESLQESFQNVQPDSNLEHYEFEFEFDDDDLNNDFEHNGIRKDTMFNEYNYKYKFKINEPNAVEGFEKEIRIVFDNLPDEDIEVIILGDDDIRTEEIIRHNLSRLHEMHELDRLNRELQRHKMMIDMNEQKKRAFEESIRNLERNQNYLNNDIVWIDENCVDPNTGKHIEKKVVYRKRFNSHWAGFEFGLLNFLNDSYQLANTDEMTFMEVIPEKTFAYRLNIFEFNIPLHKYYFGLATGAGIDWNSMALAQNITLFEDENDILQADFIPLNDTEFKRNKLNAAYITIPVLFEFQIPVKYNKFYVRAGVTGSMRAWSKQKQIFFVEDRKYKNNNIDDFQLNPFRYGISTGIGYGNIGLFADYSLVPMFKNGHGPKVFPVTIGLHIIDF
jgi:hypothetical protein